MANHLRRSLRKPWFQNATWSDGSMNTCSTIPILLNRQKWSSLSSFIWQKRIWRRIAWKRKKIWPQNQQLWSGCSDFNICCQSNPFLHVQIYSTRSAASFQTKRNLCIHDNLQNFCYLFKISEAYFTKSKTSKHRNVSVFGISVFPSSFI